MPALYNRFGRNYSGPTIIHGNCQPSSREKRVGTQAYRPHHASGVDCEGVIEARRNMPGTSRTNADGVGHQRILLMAPEAMSFWSAQLVLFVHTPSPDNSAFVKGNGMVSSASDVRYVLESRNENWVALDLGCLFPVVNIAEALITPRVLRQVSKYHSRWSGCGDVSRRDAQTASLQPNLPRKCPIRTQGPCQ